MKADKQQLQEIFQVEIAIKARAGKNSKRQAEARTYKLHLVRWGHMNTECIQQQKLGLQKLTKPVEASQINVNIKFLQEKYQSYQIIPVSDIFMTLDPRSVESDSNYEWPGCFKTACVSHQYFFLTQWQTSHCRILYTRRILALKTSHLLLPGRYLLKQVAV